MNLPSNLLKSIVLATIIFWIINISNHVDNNLFFLVMLSLIPISISVTLVIVLTICPIFTIFQRKNESNKIVVKKCFPYYVTTMFGLCIFGIFTSDFDTYFISFFVSTFFTTAQSWIWFSKDKNI